MDRSKKKKISNVLKENREWFDINEKIPNQGERVIIRITNDKYIYGEDDNEIYYAEDIKVATFAKSYNSDECRFIIDPPYPMFDYSPLSRKDRLLEGTVITHWAYPDEGELEGWDTRFDISHEYDKLRIEVDPEHAEDVYRAFMWGASFIAQANAEEFKSAKPGEGIRRLHETLYDLLACMDKNCYIENGKMIPLNDKGEDNYAMEE